LLAIVVAVWVLQLVISWVLVRQRRAQEQARDRLQRYTWRLEQLLPHDADPRRAIQTLSPEQP
jgi:hypothetical protein